MAPTQTAKPTRNPAPKATAKAKPKKRAREDDGGGGGFRKRKRTKAFDRADPDLDLDLEAGLNKKIAFLDSMLLADHLAQKTRRFGTDLKPVELSALDISPNAIRDSSSFSAPRTLSNLPAFLEAHAAGPGALGSAPEENGAPHTIVVTGAGLRAAELVRAVRKYQSNKITVGKLFAKHIKIEESKKFLETHRTGVSVGTPTRLNDLVDSGALKLDKLERLVVDASHIDQKKRGIMDMKETMIPLVRWLSRPEFKEKYTEPERPLQLLFY
ncbi:putative replication regulator protein [Rosellinia necatrix]|uniref:Putative replication regulator protein n=1 Tax=Rosellinia necatrix TaxID=77044 RepID=A0A1W2TX85_ROSNE|nr:putative replication regulator protein [Rosellinia necatrix]